jgi:hypothetical protein
MNTAYGNLFLVTEVRLSIVWRQFTHNVRTTIEGKFAVATIVAAPFLMKSLLVSSALRQASMNEDAGWVVLWTAHLFMMAALVLFVAALFGTLQHKVERFGYTQAAAVSKLEAVSGVLLTAVLTTGASLGI